MRVRRVLPEPRGPPRPRTCLQHPRAVATAGRGTWKPTPRAESESCPSLRCSGDHRVICRPGVPVELLVARGDPEGPRVRFRDALTPGGGPRGGGLRVPPGDGGLAWVAPGFRAGRPLEDRGPTGGPRRARRLDLVAPDAPRFLAGHPPSVGHHVRGWPSESVVSVAGHTRGRCGGSSHRSDAGPVPLGPPRGEEARRRFHDVTAGNGALYGKEVIKVMTCDCNGGLSA